jgi:hypothetical protein
MVPILVTMIFTLFLVPVASGGNFHFNNINFSLGSLVMDGTLVGLGNDVAEVTVTGYGTVTALCQNNGGKQAPGRNPISANVQQTDVFVSDSNGRALVRVVTSDPTLSDFEPSPTPKEAGCPNNTWTVVEILEGSTNWTGATVIVKDASGEVRIELSFTCTTFFENGVATDIQCVES